MRGRRAIFLGVELIMPDNVTDAFNEIVLNTDRLLWDAYLASFTGNFQPPAESTPASTGTTRRRLAEVGETGRQEGGGVGWERGYRLLFGGRGEK
jgi:hypothetical protein